MNFGAFISPPHRRCPPGAVDPRRTSEGAMPMKGLSMKTLSECPRQALPLDVHVTSASIVEGHAVYHCMMSSVLSKKSWTISYRYSEFYALKNTVQEVLTCGSQKCSGSCQAIRDYINTCFPKKRMLFSTSQRAIHDRQEKFENVLLHLLRCVLLPGSAMKCADARHNLPVHLFEFLGVEDEQDRRSLLQIYVDNYQSNLKHSSFSGTSTSSSSDDHHQHSSDTDCTQCMICLEDVDMDDHHSSSCRCDDDDDATESSSKGSRHSSSASDHAGAVVVLPCNHTFHRECVFEWLLFQFHCPLCRTRVGPPAVTNYCRAKNRVQWWLGEFEEDPLLV